MELQSLWATRPVSEPPVSPDDFVWHKNGAWGHQASSQPRITIQGDGGVSINCAASKLLYGPNPPEVAYALVGIDPSNRRIGIMAADEGNSHALRSQRSSEGGGYAFSVVPLLKSHGYELGTARRWEAHSGQAGVIYADLSGPFDVVGRKR